MSTWRRSSSAFSARAGTAALCFVIVLGAFSAPAQNVTTLIQFTNVWKYDQSGRDLGTAWRTNDYDDSTWPSGPGLLGLEPDTPGFYTVHAPINTPLTISSTVTTFYFRTTFEFTGTTIALSLIASNLVDDGCAIYLNGLRAGGVRAPAAYDASTFFAGPTMEGQLDQVTLTNLDALRAGMNLLAVEVHQAAAASSDVMWGMRLLAIQQTPLAITNQPQSQTVIVNTPVTLSVAVSGGPAFYHWQKDGVNIANATSSSYAIPSAQPGNSGEYRVIITNSISAITSTVATLTVLADLTGPRLVTAIAANSAGGTTFATNTINVLFSEPLSLVLAQNSNNYAVTVLGTTNRIPVLRVVYSAALGALLNLDGSDPDWVVGGSYMVTINGVKDTRGNVIAPDSSIAVSWGQSSNLIASDAVWDFHNSAVFEPEVFDQDWFACDFSPGPWWGQGQGLFYGGAIVAEPCPPLGTLQTPTGYQPEPALYRTTFQWPSHWPSAGTLKIAAAYDDALVLYLDGTEIYRNNAGATGSIVGPTSKALSALSVCVTNLAIAATNLQPGVHCLAAAVLQADAPPEFDSVFALRMDGLAYLAPPLAEQPSPVLTTAQIDANSLRISWAGNGYALESTTNLSLGSASYPSGPWQEVTNMSNPYTNHLDEAQRFFRLKK